MPIYDISDWTYDQKIQSLRDEIANDPVSVGYSAIISDGAKNAITKDEEITALINNKSLRGVRSLPTSPAYIFDNLIDGAEWNLNIIGNTAKERSWELIMARNTLDLASLSWDELRTIILPGMTKSIANIQGYIDNSKFSRSMELWGISPRTAHIQEARSLPPALY